MSTSAPQSPGGTAGVGQPGFVAKHGLFSDEQASLAQALVRRIRELDLRTVRFVLVDQHGTPRSRSLSAQAAIDVFANGLDFSGAIYSLDTGNNVFVPPFAPGGGFGIEEFTGFPDVVLVPDPGTFRVLPWADRTGWILCDVYFSNGQPVPLDGRHLMRRMLRDLGEAGYDYLAGLEIEYYIVKVTDQPLMPQDAGFTPPPPPVSVFERGYQFLSEVRLDSVAGTLEAIRDGLTEVGLPPRSMEDEWGPGQMEFSFAPMAGLAAADAAVLFRSAVKQICQAPAGCLATFMCLPGLPNFFSSGWHLHECLIQRPGGQNAFASPDANLSAAGRQFVSGLLDHALPMMMFAAPTVNGYRRYRPLLPSPPTGWAGRWRPAASGSGYRARRVTTAATWRTGSASPPPTRTCTWPRTSPPRLDGIRRGLDAAPVDEDPYASRGADAAHVTGRGGQLAGEGRVLPAGVREILGRLPADDEARPKLETVCKLRAGR